MAFVYARPTPAHQERLFPGEAAAHCSEHGENKAREGDATAYRGWAGENETFSTSC
jgi:hypothetical protein